MILVTQSNYSQQTSHIFLLPTLFLYPPLNVRNALARCSTSCTRKILRGVALSSTFSLNKKAIFCASLPCQYKHCHIFVITISTPQSWNPQFWPTFHIHRQPHLWVSTYCVVQEVIPPQDHQTITPQRMEEDPVLPPEGQQVLVPLLQTKKHSVKHEKNHDEYWEGCDSTETCLEMVQILLQFLPLHHFLFWVP